MFNAIFCNYNKNWLFILWNKIDIDFFWENTYGNLQSLPVRALWDMLTFLHDPLPAKNIFNLFFIKQFPQVPFYQKNFT